MKISFLLPFVRLTGGVKSTLEVAKRLEGAGHEVCVYYPKYRNVMLRKSNIRRNVLSAIKPFFGLGRPYDYGENICVRRVPVIADRFIEDADVIVGTWWENVHSMMSLSGEKGVKCHFIRHYETWGGASSRVEKVYRFDNVKIVNSTWLQQIIEERHGVKPYLCLNGVDTARFYYRSDDKDGDAVTVGVMYRENPSTGRPDHKTA